MSIKKDLVLTAGSLSCIEGQKLKGQSAYHYQGQCLFESIVGFKDVGQHVCQHQWNKNVCDLFLLHSKLNRMSYLKSWHLSIQGHDVDDVDCVSKTLLCKIMNEDWPLAICTEHIRFLAALFLSP